jgi:hypothetical protein
MAQPERVRRQPAGRVSLLCPRRTFSALRRKRDHHGKATAAISDFLRIHPIHETNPLIAMPGDSDCQFWILYECTHDPSRCGRIRPAPLGSCFPRTNRGATTDWRLDKDAQQQDLPTGFYNPAITSLNVNATTSADPLFFFTTPFPGQQAPPVQGTITALNGTVAFGWHTMTILADSDAGTAQFTVDSTYIGTLNQSLGVLSIAGSGSLTLLDAFTSVSNPDLNADRVFAVLANYKVEAVPEPTASSLLALSAFLLLRRRRNAA